MPLLSFVLVAHREQAQLEECADALLTEGADEVELVFVDDASPDHSAEVLAALAERDGRIRVLRLAERAGLGPAREAGRARATGDHLWFLRPSDRPAPGTLSAVCERLYATAPDVLLVDHARADALGRERPGPLGGLLRRVAADGTTTLDRRPGLAAAAPRIWDKVFRRAHLEQLGVTGASGELALTWPALLAAERIGAAPAARLLRRRLPNAPREPRATAQEMCTTYEAVFAFLAAHPELPDGRRRLVLPALQRHELRELERLPPADQPAYFAALSDLWRRHRRGDEPAPAGRAQRLEARLLERGDWRGHRALRAALDQRAALARRRRTVARRGRRALGAARRRDLQRYYLARRDEPIDPDLAVFAAYWYRGYACNPRAIYERARELVPRIHGVWVVKPDAVDALPPGVDYVLPNTRAYYDAIARARYFVNNVNFPDHLVKREGTVHVMTHHGTPLKRMGLDLRATPVAGRRMDFAALMRRCARWDYSVSSNVFSTLVWERVYPTRYESLEVGYPRNDVLATAGAEEVARIRASLGIEPGRQAVLYAPTHREYQTGYVPVLDLAAVADGLGPEYVIMARLHYFYDADPHLRELHRQGRVRDVAEHPSVEELSLAADVLVTDYSSLMFDYAVLDRPIVIHAPDWDVYRALRGTYFDLLAEPPGVVARTEDELVAALRAGDVAEPERAAFRARFCALDDGRAAERVVRRVFPGARAAAPAEPVVR
jgi:CDP-glycerol glycerophosphotransferase